MHRLGTSTQFRMARHAWAGLALMLVMASCTRRDDGASESASKPQASAASQSAATQVHKDVASGSETQPDFLEHPPLHLKPPCATSSVPAANEGIGRCVTLTLRCSELDRDESVWLATSPAIATIRLPQGTKGLRVTVEDEVSATVCCKAAGADGGPVKAQLRLFTNEVVGATQEIECP